MVFRAFAATRTEVIQTRHSLLQFARSFADGLAVPAEFAFGTPLASRPKLFDCSGHKQPASTSFQCLGSLTEQGFERVSQFHWLSSRIREPGAFYITWDD